MYPLFEVYDEDNLEEIGDQLDTSFGMFGSISYSFRNPFIPVLGLVGEIDEFTFVSSEEQLVTVVLTPEKSLDDFDIEVNIFNFFFKKNSLILMYWFVFCV